MRRRKKRQAYKVIQGATMPPEMFGKKYIQLNLDAIVAIVTAVISLPTTLSELASSEY